MYINIYYKDYIYTIPYMSLLVLIPGTLPSSSLLSWIPFLHCNITILSIFPVQKSSFTGCIKLYCPFTQLFPFSLGIQAVSFPLRQESHQVQAEVEGKF